MTKSMTKFLCQKTEWIGNKNVKMYYPPALSWTEGECDGALFAMRLNERQSNEFKDNSKGLGYYNFASKGVEHCSSFYDMTEHSHHDSRDLYGMGQDNNHVPLHASALSLNQPCNKLGDGPKRRASEAAPRSQDRMNIDKVKGLVELDKSHIVQVATCSFPPIVIQDGKLVERPHVLWDRDRPS